MDGNIRHQWMVAAAVVATVLYSFALSAQEIPVRWKFDKSYDYVTEGTWENDHYVDATVSGKGVMTAVHADGSPLESYKVINGRAAAGPFAGGDSFMFDVPAAGLQRGSFISFDATLSAEPGAPMEWVLEWQDGGRWVSGRKYICHGPAFGKQHLYTTIHYTFRLADRQQGESVKVRLRALEGERIPEMDGRETTGMAMFVSSSYIGANVQNLGTSEPEDTTRVLCIGNSFTYYNSCPLMLKEIAWSQGHYLDMNASVKGGRNMAHHHTLATTVDLLQEGGYDIVYLQDQSQGPARVGYDRKKNASQVEAIVKMADMVRATSEDCRVVIECTWAYPGKKNGGFDSVSDFYRYAGKGAEIMARKVGTKEISPIRDAFRLAALECPDIMLFSSDSYHQSPYGSYLKSCVNYLLLFGEPFAGEAADCGLDPNKTAALRNIAEKCVLL